MSDQSHSKTGKILDADGNLEHQQNLVDCYLYHNILKHEVQLLSHDFYLVLCPFIS